MDKIQLAELVLERSSWEGYLIDYGSDDRFYVFFPEKKILVSFHPISQKVVSLIGIRNNSDNYLLKHVQSGKEIVIPKYKRLKFNLYPRPGAKLMDNKILIEIPEIGELLNTGY